MKKKFNLFSLSLIVLLLSVSAGYSQTVFRDIDFEKAMEMSKKKKLPIFIDFYATW